MVGWRKERGEGGVLYRFERGRRECKGRMGIGEKLGAGMREIEVCRFWGNESAD